MIAIKEQKYLVANQVGFFQRKLAKAKDEKMKQYYNGLIEKWQAVLETLTKAEQYGFDELSNDKL